MKASPELQRRLLDLQAVDTALAQLAHRRRTLPELAEIDTAAREISRLKDQRVRAQAEADDLARAVGWFARHVDQVRTRKDRDQRWLDERGGDRGIARKDKHGADRPTAGRTEESGGANRQIGQPTVGLYLDAAGVSTMDSWPDRNVAVRSVNETAHLH